MATLTITLDNDQQIAFVKEAVEILFDMMMDEMLFTEVHNLTWVKPGESKCITNEDHEKIMKAVENAVTKAADQRLVLVKLGTTPWK